MLNKNICMMTYLLQVDVFIDDSLVPLRVETLACVFGPPLVFSTEGTHHNKTHSVRNMPEPCRRVKPPQYTGHNVDRRRERMKVMHIVRTTTMYEPTCMKGRYDVRVRCKKVHFDVKQVI